MFKEMEPLGRPAEDELSLVMHFFLNVKLTTRLKIKPSPTKIMIVTEGTSESSSFS